MSNLAGTNAPFLPPASEREALSPRARFVQQLGQLDYDQQLAAVRPPPVQYKSDPAGPALGQGLGGLLQGVGAAAASGPSPEHAADPDAPVQMKAGPSWQITFGERLKAKFKGAKFKGVGQKIKLGDDKVEVELTRVLGVPITLVMGLKAELQPFSFSPVEKKGETQHTKVSVGLSGKGSASIRAGLSWLNAYASGDVKLAAKGHVVLDGNRSVSEFTLLGLEASLAGTIGAKLKPVLDVGWVVANPKLFTISVASYKDGQPTVAGAEWSKDVRDFVEWLEKAEVIAQYIESKTPEFIKEYRLHVADVVYDLNNGEKNAEDMRKHGEKLNTTYGRVEWLDKNIEVLKHDPKFGKQFESASGRLKLASRLDWPLIKFQLEAFLASPGE